MTEDNKQENQQVPGQEPSVVDQAKDANPATADEIKSQVDGDLKEMNEKESGAGKDWAAELKAIEDKYVRLYAEFDNYKRRTSAERIELFKTANQEVLVSLLPVLDDLERGLTVMRNAQEVAPVLEGVELISNKLRNTLLSKGLKVMESVGKDFDSDYHEAITNIPAPSEDMKGKVVDEVEKGYFLGDKVVRFAKVIVGQ